MLLLIALALIFARVVGYIFSLLKQPAVIGEIIAGFILGAIGLIAFSGELFSFDISFSLSFIETGYTAEEFQLLAEIGILFMLFLSGLQTSFSKLKKMGKISFYVAVGGVITPLLLGFIVSTYFFSWDVSIIIGLILTATSVGVTVRALIDMQRLDTDVGTVILGAAVIDDVLGILLLTFILGIQSIYDAVWVSLRIAIFFFVFLYIGLKIIDRILDLGEKIYLPKAFLSISLSILLLYSYFADRAGIAGIVGAFVAGLLIGQTVKSKKILDDVQAIGLGFFIPLFFVWVGVTLWNGIYDDFSSVLSVGLIAILLIFVAVIGKILGCGLGAKLGGMENLESLQVGIGMIPRMEVALIIASVVISRGLIKPQFEHQLLTITVLIAIVTTIITPFLIKAVFKKE